MCPTPFLRSSNVINLIGSLRDKFLSIPPSTLRAAIGLVFAVMMISIPASGQGICPPVGKDTNCGVIITVTDTGAAISLTGQPPYDDIEDTLVGVVNNSSLPIHSLILSANLQIFGFDGDGIDTFGIPGNAIDHTGYGGPNAFFTNIDPSLKTGTVNFIVAIAPKGGSSFFSLEEAITAVTACSSLINNAVGAGSEWTQPVSRAYRHISHFYSQAWKHSKAGRSGVRIHGFRLGTDIHETSRPKSLLRKRQIQSGRHDSSNQFISSFQRSACGKLFL